MWVSCSVIGVIAEETAYHVKACPNQAVATNLHGDQEFWAGIAVQEENSTTLKVGIAIHDGTYSVDFAIHRISLEDKPENEDGADWAVDHIITELKQYRKDHLCKLLGAGITPELHHKAPNLCSRLWAELDIVPIVLPSAELLPGKRVRNQGRINVDELADSNARKCLSYV